jgi:hypothetical protein
MIATAALAVEKPDPTEPRPQRVELAIRVDCGDHIEYKCRHCRRTFLHEPSPKSESMGVPVSHKCRCGTISRVKVGYFEGE